MIEFIVAVIFVGLYLMGREAVHQIKKHREFKRVCAFLEKASR